MSQESQRRMVPMTEFLIELHHHQTDEWIVSQGQAKKSKKKEREENGFEKEESWSS